MDGREIRGRESMCQLLQYLEKPNDPSDPVDMLMQHLRVINPWIEQWRDTVEMTDDDIRQTCLLMIETLWALAAAAQNPFS